MSEFRVEHDSMGEVKVPAEAKWRAQTQRAVENFPIDQGLGIRGDIAVHLLDTDVTPLVGLLLAGGRGLRLGGRARVKCVGQSRIIGDFDDRWRAVFAHVMLLDVYRY